jgi:hypothetical protein
MNYEINKMDNDRHDSRAIENSFICTSCFKSNSFSYIYKCLICPVELCGDCYEKKYETEEHKTDHPLVRLEAPKKFFGLKYSNNEINLFNIIKIFQNTRHDGFFCSICLMDPIVGVLFKCDTCYKFYLCLDCYMDKRNKDEHLHKDHNLIVSKNKRLLDINISDIEFIKNLGTGAYGSVYKSKLKNSDKIVACKIIQVHRMADSEAQSRLYQSYLNEVNSYNEVKGENILKCFGHCIENSSIICNMIIITEFMSKGSIACLLKNEPQLSYRRRFQIANDITSGMARIHSLGFIHRDIRPDNVLIAADYSAKIGDFGIAKLLENNRNTIVGCPPYMPPEFYTGKYDYKLDIFTFGLTLNELYGGSHFVTQPIRINKQAVLGNKLIAQCVDLDPKNRPDSFTIKINAKKYRDKINKSIENHTPDYQELNLNRKNEIFLHFYSYFENLDTDYI